MQNALYVMSELKRVFARSERGSIALPFALVLPVLAMSTGAAVDFASRADEHRRLQIVADSASIAALRKLPDTAAATQAAIAVGGANRQLGDVITSSDVEFGTWSDGAFSPGGENSAIRVTASRTADKGNAFKGIFSGTLPFFDGDISANATVMSGGGTDPICILILDPDGNDALDIDPDAQIVAPDCAVRVNSDHRGAVEIGSGAVVDVASMDVVGGVSLSRRATLAVTPSTGVSSFADPYADLPEPRNDDCGGAKRIRDTTTTITAEFAFCDGLVLDNAHVTLEPGVYVIKDEFTMKNGSSIEGENVLIFLQHDGSDMFFYSNTSFNVSGRTEGIYEGMLLWSDDANNNDHDFYSKVGLKSSGTIYMPNSQLEFEDNVQWETDCIRIVARELELDNGSIYKSSDPEANCSDNIYSSVKPRLLN